MAKYLLTSGKISDKIEDYIIDLFNLYLTIQPNDVPQRSDIGFDYSLIGVMKDELNSKIKEKINSLIDKIKNKIGNSSISIEISSILLTDEENVQLIISINGVKQTSSINFNIYK